ncbi:hypothetical protein ACFWA5_43340 [Streptomyces mirabilis]
MRVRSVDGAVPARAGAGTRAPRAGPVTAMSISHDPPPERMLG